MESQEFIDAFRTQLDQVESQGHQQLQVAAIRTFLDALERDASASQEYRNREHAGMLAHYAARSQHSIEMLKAVLEAGKSALHALLIINGGAVVALLEKATGVKAFSVGKPSPVMMRAARKELGLEAAETTMIGDTMDTDILGGVQLGYRTILVLSGSTSRDDLKDFAYRPDLVVDSIADLLIPSPAIEHFLKGALPAESLMAG